MVEKTIEFEFHMVCSFCGHDLTGCWSSNSTWPADKVPQLNVQPCPNPDCPGKVKP